MATVVAQASGNFSAGATWVGGVKPQTGDIAETGNFVVTINEDFTGTLRPTGSGRFEVATGGITITGDLVMQSTYTGGGLRCTHSSGIVTLTGTATGGAGSYAYGAFNNGAGTLNVGTATGGAGGSSVGAYNNSTGTLNVGTATGGAGGSAHGAFNSAAGTLICDLAVGGNWGVGGSGAETVGVRSTGVVGQITKVKRIQFGPYGATPVFGAILIEPDATNSAQFRTAFGGGTLTLTDPSAAADFPAQTNVRHGVSYDNGDKVGTAYIPHPNDVAYGVPVDATVGNAVLTAATVAAGVWDATRSGHVGAGTFGATGEWAGSVDEAAIASAVRTELATELGRLDATVSSRLAPTTAGRTLDVAATGEASANVTRWRGDPVPEPDTAGLPDVGTLGNISAEVSQQVRNAMALATEVLFPAAGSIDTQLGALPTAAENAGAVWDEALAGHNTPGSTGAALAAAGTAGDPWSTELPGAYGAGTAGKALSDILEDTGTTLPGLITGLSGATVTVVSSVDGGTVTVYVADTWRFTVASDQLDLADYETLGLVVKRNARQGDTQALLYLRTDTGLIRMDGAAPVSSGNGSLTKTATSFTAVVHVTETQNLAPGGYTWWLKGLDTTPTPDEAVTLATGEFVVLAAGLQAVV